MEGAADCMGGYYGGRFASRRAQNGKRGSRENRWRAMREEGRPDPPTGG